MPNATAEDGFSCPDLTSFCGLDELGLITVGQRLEPDRAVLACRVVDDDRWCHRCGCQGIPRGSVVRRLSHEPLGWRPTTLRVTVGFTLAPAAMGSFGPPLDRVLLPHPDAS